MMILVADLGNSRCTFAIVREGAVLATIGAPTAHFTFRKARGVIAELMSSTSPRDISRAAISSVVPTHTTLTANAIEDVCGLTPVLVSHETAKIDTTYSDPASIGADRICNAVAAYAVTGGAAIVIDCGTAATIDCVDERGGFVGGAILPGYRTAIKALHHGTAQLPDIPMQAPPRAMGQGTVENIQSGIILGTTFAIEGIVRRIIAESYFGSDVPIIVTGGHGEVFRALTSFTTRSEPDLVLLGAALVAEK